MNLHAKRMVDYYHAEGAKARKLAKENGLPTKDEINAQREKELEDMEEKLGFLGSNGEIYHPSELKKYKPVRRFKMTNNFGTSMIDVPADQADELIAEGKITEIF